MLFYGNLQREPEAGGLYDFYVLTESDAAYHGPGISALANRLLPPNVYLIAHPDGPRAKVAVMTLAAFSQRMRPDAWDTTLWARFCQPAILTFSRDGDVRKRVLEAVVRAHKTAAQWASALAEPGVDTLNAWETLFRHTYAAELRVEGSARPRLLAERGAEIYSALMLDKAIGSEPASRDGAKGAWRNRRIVGKILNASRLLKACFTFQNPLAYALDKIERHSSGAVALSGWERRHPLLAFLPVLLRLWRARRRH